MVKLQGLPRAERELVRSVDPPRSANPMKAVLTNERFSHPDWIFERKLDGIRCIAIRDQDEVTLLSRNNLSMNGRYPDLVEALGRDRCSRFVVDGEVVAFDGAQTSFAALAQRGRRDVHVYLYLFDLLWLEGHDVRGLPLRSRKRLLRGALQFRADIRYTPHRNGEGEAFFAEACRKGWEGLIAKRADSPYVTTRSRDWLKFKCARGQEMVIGGFTPPRGSRVELGALLVGHYRDGELVYAGKVGTGFNRATLEELGEELRARRQDGPPFVDANEIRERGVTWVTPELVAEVGFTEWTRDGRLRHPRFLGLRYDKPDEKVVREE